MIKESAVYSNLVSLGVSYPAVKYVMCLPCLREDSPARLMRCGPAFDLQGQPSSHGSYLNQVVLDSVEAFRIEQDPQLPLLQLKLEQSGRGRDQLVRSSAVG